jgi:hypothetical protein
MDYMLEQPEPQAIREEKRNLVCFNDDCAMFESEVEILVEIEYWSDTEARFDWECDSCRTMYDREFNPMDEIDWDSYYEGR